MNEEQNAQSGFGADPNAGASGTQQGDAGGMKEQAKEKARQFASTARRQTSEKAEERFASGKQRVAEAIGQVAESLRLSTDYLNESNQARTGRYVERASDQMQRFSQYLEGADVRQILDGTERFARRQPAMFLGGAFVLGLLGARFLKSSANDADDFASSGSDMNVGSQPYSGMESGDAAWGGTMSDRERETPLTREMGDRGPMRGDLSDLDAAPDGLDSNLDYPGASTGPFGAQPGTPGSIDR